MFFIRNYIENNLLSYYLINKYDYTIYENCGIRKLFLRSIFLKILKKKRKEKIYHHVLQNTMLYIESIY